MRAEFYYLLLTLPFAGGFGLPVRLVSEGRQRFNRTMRYIALLILLALSGQTIPVLGQTICHASESCELKYDSVLSRSYYTTVDKMPTFKGGRKKLIKTINKNLKWPGGRCDIEGTVFIGCIIESNGQLTNKRILKGLLDDNFCNADNEALNVIDFLTTWTPGQCEGKSVAVQYVIPVKFKMMLD
jgi:TonB family protein